MAKKSHFSLRKVLFRLLTISLCISVVYFAAAQTIKITGGQKKYDEFINITNSKLAQISGEIETIAQVQPATAQITPSPVTNTRNDVEIIYPDYLNSLTIESLYDDSSGLVLANLSNNSNSTQSAKKVLTVNESGSVILADNNPVTTFPDASGGNPLYYDSDIWKSAGDIFFSSGEIGIGKSPGVELDVDGKTAIEGKLTVHSDWEDNLIELFPNGNSGYLSSEGGALYINNTNNYGSGIGIYSNADGGAQGNMINVKVDNPLYNQAAFYMNYDGLSNAVEIVSNTDDESSNALSITNFNNLDSALGVIGYENGKGTVKVTHIKDGADANASGISVDLKGTGTAAQGIYVDSTATGGTTGKLLRLRNQTLDRFVVDSTGSLTIGRNGTNTSITKVGNTAGDEFFVGTNGAFRIQRSATDSEAFRTQIVGDTQGRWLGTSDGKLKWGDGSSAQDVVLERSGTSQLQLDGASFEIVSPATNTDILTLTASDNSRLGRFVETGGGHGWFEVDNNTGTAQVLLRADGGDHYFRTGEVGIGTTTPGYQLDVLEDFASGYAANFFNDGNNANRYGLRVQAGADDGSGTTYYLDAYDGDGNQVGYIANDSGTFGLTDISDARTKTNIVNTQIDALGIINGLRVVDFNRKDHPDGPTIHGFIAQEVDQVFPEMVTSAPNGLLGVQKEALIPVLTKATQDQDKKITQLSQVSDALGKVMEFAQNLIIKTQVLFKESVAFAKQAFFQDSIKAGENIAGKITIPTGETVFTVYFTDSQTSIPIIQLTAQSKLDGNLYVDNISRDSFEIHLEKSQTNDVDIAWFSLITQ